MPEFRDFDFTHGAFINAQPKVKEILLASYKKKWLCGDFIDAIQAAEIKSRGKRSRQYRNAHAISETYEKLDTKFNFFGNYS